MYGRVHQAVHTAGAQPRVKREERTEAATLSPVLLATAVPLLISFVGLVLDYSPYAFSTLTNLCYVGAAVQREIVSYAELHGAYYKVGQLGGASLILILLGASSMAHHESPLTSVAAHHFDLLFGLVLVFHVAYVTVTTVLFSWLPYFEYQWIWRTTRTLSVGGFVAGIFAVVLSFDSLRAKQINFYLPAAITAALAGSVLRFGLAERGNVKSLLLALAEVIVLLTAATSAAFVQCSLLGKQIGMQEDPERNDLYHGLWHFLLSFLVGALYSRSADATRSNPCLCDADTVDMLGMAAVFAFSVSATVLKEAGTPVSTARWILGVEAGVIGLYCVLCLKKYVTNGAIQEQLLGSET